MIRSTMRDVADATVHTLTVTVQGLRPAVWRRLEVPSALPVGSLDDVLLAAFGSEPAGTTDDDPTPLGEVMTHPGDVVEYTGPARLRHRIRVERIDAADLDARYPRCTAGAGQPPGAGAGRVKGAGPDRDAEARRPAFDARAREQVNQALSALGITPPRAADGPGDPFGLFGPFAGVFPALTEEAGVCPCGCGMASDSLAETLPVYHPQPDDVLAALAAGSGLVRQAVALARWLGAGRATTSSGLLKPADAIAVATELELYRRLLPRSGDPDDPGDDRDDHSGSPAPADSPRKLRSAKDLPYLHPLWTGAVEAGLIDVRGGKAYPGAALAVWQGPAVPKARIESWATLLGGYLHARDEAAGRGGGLFDGIQEQLLPATAPVLYASAREPVPLGALAVTLADVMDGDGGPSSLYLVPVVVGEAADAIGVWLLAGVVEVVEDCDGVWVVPDGPLGELITELRDEATSSRGGPDIVARLIAPIVETIEEGPLVRLTPLGQYGLARLLVAHGWDVPTAGDCAELGPAELLDRLIEFSVPDALDEAATWLDARGGAWESAVRDVAAAAAISEDDGPSRRAVLPLVLRAAGPRVVPLLAGLEHDEWLAVPVAIARHLLGAGPEPTLAHRLWFAVDQLSPVVDEGDDLEDSVDDTEIFDLLAAPAGMSTAVGLSHPRTREVLRAVLPLAPSRALAKQLRQALSGRGSGPASGGSGGRSGRPALRSVGGSGKGSAGGSGGRPQ